MVILDKDEVLRNFPAPSFRKYQKEALEKIVDEINVGVKCILLDAPCGFGKSAVNIALCRSFGNAFYATPQLVLIDQMLKDKIVGSHIVEIKGRQNYFCTQDPSATVDVGLCRRIKDFKCINKLEDCPYWKQKMRAIGAQTAIMSFAYFLLEGRSIGDKAFNNRELLVLDECLPYNTEVVTIEGFEAIGTLIGNPHITKVSGISGNNVVETDILERSKTRIKECVKVTTVTKRELICSEDHPLYDYTSGWMKAKDTDRVAIVNERKRLRGEIYVLARLFGYLLGDGSMSVGPQFGGSGDIVDLELIRNDLRGLGYNCEGEVNTRYQIGGGTHTVGHGYVRIEGTTNWLSLPVEVARLFDELGYPIGEKTDVEFYVPQWIMLGSNTVKAEFLAGLFGAESGVPAVHRYSPEVIRLRMYKNVELFDSHRVFFEEVKKLLNDLGIEVSQIKESEGNIRKDGSVSAVLTLTIANSKNNILKFFEKVGFAYCKRKEREVCKIHAWLAEGKAILDLVNTNWTSVSRRYSLPFSDWCKEYVIGDIVFEKVLNIEDLGMLQTYNLKTVTENFIAGDYFLVHNSHNIDRYVLSYISLTISPYSLTYEIYKKVESLVGNVQSDTDATSLVSTTKDFVEIELESSEVQQTLTGEEISIGQASAIDRLQNFVSGADNYLSSLADNEWVWKVGWASYKGSNHPKLTLQPLYARTFMQSLIWRRAEFYIVSSATLLNPNIFLHEVGLDRILKKEEVLHITIPSTFPVENRPIIDRTNGKLTRDKLDQNFYPAVKILERILDQEEGKNLAVHCHSYRNSIGIQNMIDTKYKNRLVTHTSETREEALETWKNSRGKVFLSVSFEEGQDWLGDICEAQVLFKVPFLDLADQRVARRLEKRDWKWYYNEALKTTVQSYGRAVRSEDDKARFYVIDASFVDLLRRCKGDIPRWIKEVLPPHWRTIVEFK